MTTPSASTNPSATEAQVAEFRATYQAVIDSLSKVIVGHKDILSGVVTGFVCGGHVLLEGVPGLGKTLLVRTLSRSVDCSFSRIQFTPDLMPADITGTNIVTEEGGHRRFVFQKGPVFGNIVLADEINRATPKTQSALLEAMQEGRVTVAGTGYTLAEPFFVLATQNPIEMEGTYPLPEAQLDRFLFKLDVTTSSVSELASILGRTTGTENAAVVHVTNGAGIMKMRELAKAVPIAPHLLEYVARLVLATHPDSDLAPQQVKQYVRFGSSPRGGQAIVRASKVRALVSGRYNVSAEDIRTLAYPALRHRILLNFEGEAEGVTPDAVVTAILKAVPDVPEAIRRL